MQSLFANRQIGRPNTLKSLFFFDIYHWNALCIETLIKRRPQANKDTIPDIMNIKKQLLYTHLVFNLLPPSKFSRNQERIHLLDSSQSPIFPRDRHRITRLTVNGPPPWFSNVPMGRASGIISAALGGGGRENILLASSQTATAPYVLLTVIQDGNP